MNNLKDKNDVRVIVPTTGDFELTSDHITIKIYHHIVKY